VVLTQTEYIGGLFSGGRNVGWFAVSASLFASSTARRKENRESWNKWDVIATAVMLGLVLGMYLYVSFWLR